MQAFPRADYALRIATLTALLFVLLLGREIGRLVPSERPWRLEHLRLVDASHAPNPASDITAIFARPAGSRCEIRLDFLDLPDPPEYAFTLELFSNPVRQGNAAQARTLHFSSASLPPAGTRLQADTVTDIVTLSLSDCRPQAETLLLVRTAAETLITSFGAQTAIEPLPVQFIFYNTFYPAATPLQAWRRWDGAHSGPRGERHGLRGLLEAAELYHIPLTLYGTDSPATQSALEAVGGMAQIYYLESTGLLARATGSMPPEQLLSFDPTGEGLPLEARQHLMASVVSPPSPSSHPLRIGGDFQRSTWGTYEYAHAAFAWLTARPYFFAAPANASVVSNSPASITVNEVTAAQEMLSQSDPALARQYAWLVTVLEQAAHWAEQPTSIAACNDLCILASARFYAVFDPQGGRLVFLFVGPEQIIAPTAQFFIGLSDRSQWDLSQGQAADPAQIMGAFGDADNPFRPYQAEISAIGLRFRSADGREKRYRLTETGLEAAFSPAIQSRIPVALSPQTRFLPAWTQKYHLEPLPDGIQLQVEGGAMLRIQVSAGQVTAVDSFLDAVPFLTFPEDPNLELSPGFFLPFPFTVVHISASKLSFTVFP
ncbi:MAG: hypothetical protein N2117_05305 [Anaerolineales bacterium]|nr:hypothetical protein [Anaerolineales bacterium]